MNQTLADYANVALYSAMAVFTLSMLAYAVYLAGLVPARSEAREEEQAAVLAGGIPAHLGSEAARPAPLPDTDDDVPLRARKAAGTARMLGLLGTVVLIASITMRGIATDRWPLGNMFEFGTFACMFVMVFYSVLAFRRDVRWLGLFVTAPVLLVLGLAATIWYTQASGVMPSLRSYWLVIHVTVATISVAVLTLGAATAGLYLYQLRLEAKDARSFMNRLPNAKSLERLTYSMHIVGFPLWTFTVIAGAIWARQAWGSYWNWDPKEVMSFMIWVVYAAYLHARATSGWSRAQATWVALAGFGLILVNYGIVNVYFVSQHSYSGL